MLRSLTVLLAIAVAPAAARAALNAPISFSQPGAVKLTLDQSSGGLDHILDLASVAGPVVSPLLALTESGGSPSADVLGFPPAQIGDMVALGEFGAGEEIFFRLTNVGSDRLGSPGSIESQTFSGSSSQLNPEPQSFYTLVERVSDTEIRVYWEDLFPIPPSEADPEASLLDGGYDVSFTLTLTPIPEPAGAALLLAAAVVYSGVRCGVHRGDAP